MSAKKLKVVVTRKLPAPVELRLKELFDARLNNDDHPFTQEELVEAMQTADVLVPTVTDKLDGRIMARAGDQLRLIAQFGAGVDNIDVQSAVQRGITVTNTPGVLTDDTADVAMALILSVPRRLFEGAQIMNTGGFDGWTPTWMMGRRLAGKRLGIIGMGNIGRQVARRAAAFDLELQYYDKYHPLTPVEEETLGIQAVSMDTLLQTSDIVTTHVPLTRETYGMIGKRELETMKPTSVIINTSRGGVIDETALAEALISKTIAAAGLDVMEHEPPDPNDPLLQIENLIITPHTAGPTLESIPKRAVNAFENIQRVWDGQPAMWTAEYENL